MRTFALETYLGLVILLAAGSFFLYLLDIPFHYTPLVPLFFAVACYERFAGRRIAAVIAGGIVFFFAAPEVPALFALVLFFQMYLFVRLMFEITTFDFLVVLFFTLFFSTLLISADVALYRAAFTGSFPLADFVLSSLLNFVWIVLLFFFGRSKLREVFVRSVWL